MSEDPNPPRAETEPWVWLRSLTSPCHKADPLVHTDPPDPKLHNNGYYYGIISTPCVSSVDIKPCVEMSCLATPCPNPLPGASGIAKSAGIGQFCPGSAFWLCEDACVSVRACTGACVHICAQLGVPAMCTCGVCPCPGVPACARCLREQIFICEYTVSVRA